MSDQYDHEDAELTEQLGFSNDPCDPKVLITVQIRSATLQTDSGAVYDHTDSKQCKSSLQLIMKMPPKMNCYRNKNLDFHLTYITIAEHKKPLFLKLP